MISRAPLARAALRRRVQLRTFADKIDDFNKTKKEFKFDLGTPSETKYQGFLQQQERAREQQQAKEKWEFFQRIKGLAVGGAALVAVISTYQVVMNYKYIKTYFRGLLHFDMDISDIKDMKDPQANVRSEAKMVERMAAELDPLFLGALKDLETPGVYLFGAINGRSVPARALPFDGMYLQDLAVADDYVVGVDQKGQVFELEKKKRGADFRQISVPKISQAIICNENLYLLAKDGRTLYTKAAAAPASRFSRVLGYFRNSALIPLELARGEKLAKISPGKGHLLILTSHGRLFEMSCGGVNKGQFGPQFPNTEVPKKNVPYELTNMNYEMVVSGEQKTLSRRAFSSVSTTDFSNVAVQDNGNIWTWGDNSLCQCGKEKSASDDVQPVPRVVFNANDLANVAKTYLPSPLKNARVNVDGVYSVSETNYVQVLAVDSDLPDNKEKRKLLQQQLLMSFGNGLQGQLGLSRYLHMSAIPQVIKSLVGMQEYDESVGALRNIGFKRIANGANHTFVTLDNSGPRKDVLVFGSNEKGQFGNGKTVKSAKPLQLPKLIEPQDLEGLAKLLVRKFHDRSKYRLELEDNDVYEQVIVAGENSSAIFYRKK